MKNNSTSILSIIILIFFVPTLIPAEIYLDRMQSEQKMITENKMTQLFENFKKEIQDQDEKDIEVISDVLKDEINASEKIEALDWLINHAEKNKLRQIVMGDIYKSCLENMEGEELTEKDISEILEREEIIN